jgi:ABC-type branched-chain amino acid transport system, permease component
MLALTLDVLWGYTGILSYGQSAFFAIGAYALGLTSTHLGFTFGNAAAAFIGGLVVAAAAAALTGWLAFGRGVTVLYVSVVTLALPIIVKQGLLSGRAVHRFKQWPLRLRQFRSRSKTGSELPAARSLY